MIRCRKRGSLTDRHMVRFDVPNVRLSDFERKEGSAIGGEHRSSTTSGGLRNIIPSGNTREACSCVRVVQPSRLAGAERSSMGIVMRPFFVWRTFVLAIYASMLSGCISGGLYSDEQVREMTRAEMSASKQNADASLERQRFIRSCGGMDPLDRLDVEISDAYLNGKYGGTAKPVEYSKRCQDYRSGKINAYDAVRMGKGTDEH